MAAEPSERDQETGPTTPKREARAISEATPSTVDGEDSDGEVEEDEEEDDDEDSEPKLKYTRLTESLGTVYRNGDATSAFAVAGDKMLLGTHNGKLHVRSLPSFHSLRSYGAHQASITSVSISPFTPPLPTLSSLLENSNTAEESSKISRAPTSASTHGGRPSASKPKEQQIPAIPSNQIFIGTSSIDGTVCVMSLVDEKDYTIRNFARPVQAVALSPEYKSDRTYLSGGLAGNLIITTGGPTGYKADANTNSTAAAASGWLGSIGLGGNTGKDLILHSGEGAISNIKWSLSGKYVVWANEEGLRIMRSSNHLDGAESDFAWKRIAHVPKPNRKIWEEMAGVWKARCTWVDEKQLEVDDDLSATANGSHNPSTEDKEDVSTLLGIGRTLKPKKKKKRKIEKLIIGWGDTAWIINVAHGSAGVGRDVGERNVGHAETVQRLTFEDCIVSGLSLYTPSLLVVLAYRTRDDDDKPIPLTKQYTPKRGVQHRQNGLSPELKLLSVTTGEEVEVDTLTVSRFESLSAADYQLGTVYIPQAKPLTPAQRGALEAIGGGIWDAGVSATRLLSTGASIISIPGSGELIRSSTSVGSGGYSQGYPSATRRAEPNPSLSNPGLKIFVQSPFDCILAIKRDFGDRLLWDLEHENYKEAWELLEKHPEVVVATPDRPQDVSSPSSTPSKTQGSLVDFFADDSASQTTVSGERQQNSALEKEKRRIGDLWVQQLFNERRFPEAGRAAGRVLGSSPRWEHWILKFAQAERFDDIAPHVPTSPIKPAIPSLPYEIILGHYIYTDRVRLQELLDTWDVDLFDLNSVVNSIKNRLQHGDITEDSVEDGEAGKGWRILQEVLAKLYLADARPQEALHCYIRLQDADAVMALLKENHHLLDAIRNDIPGFILIRVSREQLFSASRDQLEEASSEAVRLLVDEAYQGVVSPKDVVTQLQSGGNKYKLFLFFYLRAVWKGHGSEKDFRAVKQRIVEDGKALLEDYGDLAVDLFAEYDRPLLMEYLKTSHNYSFDKASSICEQRDFIPELVHVLSKTGQTKRALRLIISKLGDVSLAISFVKEQNDPDLWDDLLTYSMDKPRFIRALLEEVGTAIDPITLIRRIPEGLEIEGLREGIGRMIREYGVQHSISEGVAKVLRGEVAMGMEALRAGQKRAVKFEVIHDSPHEVELFVESPPAVVNETDNTWEPVLDASRPKMEEKSWRPGSCVGCKNIFTDDERETLIGFACGHVYHLSCLLDKLPETSSSAAAAKSLQSQLASSYGIDDRSAYSSRSVGVKVTHAHLIRNVVKEGCPVCKVRQAET